MLGMLLVLIIMVMTLLYRSSSSDVVLDLPEKVSSKLDKLWSIAQASLKERKYLRAEKALLTILRVDERNATAYNRLGILYAKQHAFKDAIECFEIAQSLEPSASSLHNVGLIYFETGNYEKASLAFEQAIAMDDQVASRYIAYAKVQEKRGNTKKMLASLERAVELEEIPQTLNILADAYEREGQDDKSANLRERAAQMVIKTGAQKKVRQVRRVV